MELADLKRTRGYVRSKVTRNCNKVTGEIATYDLQKCLMYKDKLTTLQKELDELNKTILERSVKLENWEESKDLLLNEEEEYNDQIDEVASILEIRLVSLTAPQQTTPQVQRVNTSTEKLQLPKAELPTFSNKEGESFYKFINQFEKITSKHNIESYEKFMLLKSQLRGSPRNLIESLDVDSEQYEKGKELLKKAFDSDLTGKYEIIGKMAS